MGSEGKEFSGINEEVAELVLLQLKEGIERYLEQYLAELRQQIIAIYENWWDKYRVTAREIEEERDMARQSSMGF